MAEQPKATSMNQPTLHQFFRTSKCRIKLRRHSLTHLPNRLTPDSLSSEAHQLIPQQQSSFGDRDLTIEESEEEDVIVMDDPAPVLRAPADDKPVEVMIMDSL